MSEFLAFLEPPGAALDHYDCNKPYSQQLSGIPERFLDIMAIREEVFVREHKAPLNREHDADDARSFHWIVYASLGCKRSTSATSSTASVSSNSITSTIRPSAGSSSTNVQHGFMQKTNVQHGFKEKTNGQHGFKEKEQAPAESQASKLGVGCVRLITPPHAPEPVDPNAKRCTYADNPNFPMSKDEPYIRCGRLAVLKPFRGIGLSKLLLNGAIGWAAQNPDRILPPLHPTVAEQRRIDGSHLGKQESWNGLILVHILSADLKFWEDQGFVKDSGMGEWVEDSLAHLGMWKRMKLDPNEKTPTSSSASSINGHI